MKIYDAITMSTMYNQSLYVGSQDYGIAGGQNEHTCL